MTNIPNTVRDADSWELVKDIDQRVDGCTQWEADFLESCLQQLLAGRYLSYKQKQIVARIEEERS